MVFNTKQVNYKLLDFITYLIQVIPQYLEKIVIRKDELILYTSQDNLVSLSLFLKKHNRTKLTQLIDICGVDYLDRKQRFEVIYNFLSLQHNYRVRVVVQTDEFNPLPSISSLYSSALWLEREVWDTYGVFFYNHPDLRRLLTDYGFEGYPFRKDFPQIGFFEVRYDDEKKHVLYEPVELAQEFRLFNFSSPWIQVK